MIFLILPFLLQYTFGCTDKGLTAVYVVPGGTKLPNSASACFTSCATGNCTGVVFQDGGERCITIDKNNFFGSINETDYIEKTCVKKIPNKLIAFEWTDRILIDHTQKIVKSENKFKCVEECAKEKSFPCVSLMFYPESQDCLLNSASSTSANLKMDTSGYPVFYMELQGVKESVEHCLNAYRMIGYDEIEVRGETKLYDGKGGLEKCVDRCEDCDFVVYNEIFSECFVVSFDPSGQILDFINDEYQVITNACSSYNKHCNSLYVSYDNVIKSKCLEECTLDSTCQFVYQSANGTNCVVTRRKMSLPLVAQRLCADVDDLDDGSALLFDEFGTCSKNPTGQLISKNVELHQCMQLCVTHPTKSCEAISYTLDKSCYLSNDLSAEVVSDDESTGCKIFSLNVITFAIEKEKKEDEKKAGESKKKQSSKKTNRPKLHSAGKSHMEDIRIATHCNYGEMTVKITTNSVLDKGQVYVRNGHQNCSASINSEGHATLHIPHNSTFCPVSKNGDILEAVVVVSKNLKNGNNTLITVDDQLFKVRCDYSNQKKSIVVAKSMNLRSPNYSNLQLNGPVKMKPMSMELRNKRETLSAKQVQLGQSLDLIFKAPKMEKGQVYIRRCIAVDSENDEKIVLINNGCATQNAKEYVLRGEIQESSEGFILPFRAFRFRQGESVRIECEVKYCKKCKKSKCTARSRRSLTTAEDPADDLIHAELLVSSKSDSIFKNEGYCLNAAHFNILTASISLLIVLQLIILFYFFYRRKY
ncbi:unnamed protein product [Caenorhabditis angaria]|uniref:ZP domain-containing protein n=1 Tax=Caenorhabditis angaria TaxID=860376 RepID=A0A9P1N6M2_9PELO|nr:unnamed protein product [Caenorhabditis angaria]